MKYLAPLTIGVLALATLLLPSAEPPEPGDELGIERPPISICPLVQVGELDTDIAVLSNVEGDGRVTAFSSGSAAGVTDFSIGSTGSVVISASEASAIGVGGGLIELPSDTTAAGVTVASPIVRSAEACSGEPAPQVYLMGGSTAGDSIFEIVLMNPYAGDAVASLLVTTEGGIESDTRFDSVLVPALSTVVLDLEEIIPGREVIAATIDTDRGSLLAFAQQRQGGDRALWRAVVPEQDWWIVVPGGGARSLRIGNPVNSEVEYQIDLYGPDGLIERYDTGTIPARAQLRIPVDEISDQALGFRVITTAPVVAGLDLAGGGSLGRTTGSPTVASSWLLPGASNPPGGRSSVMVLNSGIEPVTLVFRSLREASHTQTVELAAEDLVEITLVEADGYRVDASGPVVALWRSTLGDAVAVAVGVPVEDG